MHILRGVRQQQDEPGRFSICSRQAAVVHDELPKYLLAPEVSALLHYVPDLRRKMLLATLWNTGARINEALALTRGDFSLTP
ncbi:tyrosine-type recombinase/integrase, partial [Escherichia coli]|nr:tyrosine-type recombinase/integrase [Escherichia coli]